MMGGAKGTPAVCCYSAVLSVCRIAGYFAGYLTWLFSRFFSLKETKMNVTTYYPANPPPQTHNSHTHHQYQGNC